jgi:RNA polymerase sigma factor (sigma-70 family)
MTQPVMDLRLSRIETLWTEVKSARLSDEKADDARCQLLQRYGGAVRRYLLGATRSSDAAEELFQEFAILFLNGRLNNADPNRGRFRDYVKGVLFRMAADRHKDEKKRRHVALEHEPAVEPDARQEEEFLTSWRYEMLARAWQALQDDETENEHLFYTVLRYRADNPDASSTEMAERLSGLQGKKLTSSNLRQLLHRARERFAELLLDEIRLTLREPTEEALEEELSDLGLMKYYNPSPSHGGRA